MRLLREAEKGKQVKVNKTVTTRYEVDLLKPVTPINLARAIQALADSGVDTERASIKISEFSSSVFIITTGVNTYYDDSTLHKMEA